jgi:hypothetical protein
MMKWIAVGVVVLAAACLAERASAQGTATPPQQMTVMPAEAMTLVPVPVTTRSGLFGRRVTTTVYYQPAYQPMTGIPVVTGIRRGTTVYYPPVYQQPIVQASATGVPVTGIQQAQAIEPVPPAAMPAPAQTVVVENPTYYQVVRRGLFGRMRVRTVRY